MLKPSFSTFLNLCRWLAALLVVISHTRHLMLVQYETVTSRNLFVKALYFVTGLGHEAVVVFFVISGLLVGALSWQKWQEAGVNWIEYGVARVSRIYTAFVPALLLGLLLDLIGLHFFNASLLYTESAKFQTTSMNFVVGDAINLKTLAGNLAMLQSIAVQSLGSNSALWSLANEWWYYCVFALVGAAAFSQGAKRLAFAAGAILLICSLPAELMLWMSIWILGLLAAAWIRWGRLVPSFPVGLILFLAALCFSRLSHNVENVAQPESVSAAFGRDLMLGLAFTVLLASSSRLSQPLRAAKLHQAFAGFSYSTYVFHFPAMVLIVAIEFQTFGLGFQVQPSVRGIMYFLATVLMIYVYCYLCASLFERHTDAVRRLLRRLVLRATPQSLKA